MTEQKQQAVPLRELVREYGYNRAHRETGINFGNFSRYLSGEACPGPEVRERVARIFGREPHEIQFPADTMTPEERRAQKIRRQVTNLWGPEIAALLPEVPGPGE